MAPALEIVDSRVEDWNISIADTIADNASSGLFVLGARSPLGNLDTAAVKLTMLMNENVVPPGSGVQCLGDPINALAWLAVTCAQNGDPLRAGEIILSGALGPMAAPAPGATFFASITDIGDVTTIFSGTDVA